VKKYKDKLIPGYTHLQIAMPSSIGLWLGAYAESLVDDMELLAAAYQVANKNPLGSGAGYGSSFPLNRKRNNGIIKVRHPELEQRLCANEPGQNRESCFYWIKQHCRYAQ
jgi:argininosuccinate lyase